MAECQTPFSYAPPVEQELVDSLSQRRFNTYLTAAGFAVPDAFQLYLYNARLSKAFLFPLHMLEVVVRNGIHEFLTARFGKAWDRSPLLGQILNQESTASLQKAQTRALANGRHSTDDVVAHLTMDFWSNLFRFEYDRLLWQTGIHKAFPNANLKGGTRATLQPLLARLNHLRNRIAHHEPIFKEPISKLYSELLDVIEHRSFQAAAWVRGHSTIHTAMRSKPHGAIVGPTVGERCDTAFVTVDQYDKIFPPPPQPPCGALIVLDGKNTVGVLGADTINAYIQGAAAKAKGLIELTDHSYADVLASVGVCEYASVPESDPLTVLPNIFRHDVRFAVVLDAKNAICGILVQAHRRY